MIKLLKIIVIIAISSCNIVIAATFNSTNFTDNGTYTTDNVSGLDWLDLTATRNRSYNDVSSKLGAGQEFGGWAYADATQITNFLNNFGGHSTYYGGWSTQNNGLFDVVAPLWGDLASLTPGAGFSYFLLKGKFDSKAAKTYGQIYDTITNPLTITNDFVNVEMGSYPYSLAFRTIGSALVRVSAVPAPPTLILIFIGLIGLSRSRRRFVLKTEI